VAWVGSKSNAIAVIPTARNCDSLGIPKSVKL
jgi:hypothetical protein